MMYIFDPSKCDDFTLRVYTNWATSMKYDLSKPVEGKPCPEIQEHLLLYFGHSVDRVDKHVFNLCPPPDRPLEYYL